MSDSRRRIGVAVRSVVVAILLLLVFFFNRDILDIRLTELDYRLSEAARDDQTSAAELLGRYELIRRRIRNGEGDLDAYRLEARLASVREDSMVSQGERLKDAGSSAGYLVLSGLRWALGKPRIVVTLEEETLSAVEEGYLLERGRKWEEAIAVYRRALEDPTLSDDVGATVRLHLAFSLSMIDEDLAARDVLASVSRQFPGTEFDIAARRLIAYLDSILSDEPTEWLDTVEQGRVAYLYMQYDEAISLLDNYLDRKGPRPAEAQARYFKGRAHEELGEFPEAIQEYGRVSFLDDEEWALQANRRMVMVGEFYADDQELARNARESLTSVEDARFLSTVDAYGELEAAAAGPDTRAPNSAQSEEGALAELWVRSEPPGAMLEVDGALVGPAPAVVSGLLPGRVALRVSHRGYRSRNEVVVIEAGRVIEHRVTLEPVVAAAQEMPSDRPAADPLPEPGTRVSTAPVIPTPSVVPDTPVPQPAVFGPPDSDATAREIRDLRSRLLEEPELRREVVADARGLAARLEATYGAQESSAVEARRVAEAVELRWSREERLRREIAELYDERRELLNRGPAPPAGQENDGFLRRLTWTSLGVGGAALGLTALSVGLGNAAYADYNAATTPEDAQSNRERTERFQAISIGGAVVATVALLTAGTSHLLRDGVGSSDGRVTEIDRQIRDLEGQFGYRGELEAGR